MELGKIEFMIQRKGMELRNLRATYDLVKGRRILLSDLTNIDDLAMVIGWHPIQESEFKALTRFIE